MFTFLRRYFITKSYNKTEQQLYSVSKEVLEIYAYNLRLKQNKEDTKHTLIQQILAQQKYSE